MRRWLTWWRMRVRALWRKDRLEADLAQEIRDHIERETLARVAGGAAPAEARRGALIAFGGMERYSEEAREARGVRLLEDLRHDLRFGLRALRLAPGFALVVVAILAVGIGLTSALFAAVNGVLLEPLPYAHADRVLVLWQSQPAAGHPREDFSPANFLDVRDEARSFDAVAAAFEHGLDHMAPDGRPETLRAWAVSEGFFGLLGADVALGRSFTAAEHAAGGPHAVLLSHAFWTTHFGADPQVIGTRLTLDGEPHEVIGVLPASFAFPSVEQIWVPARFTEESRRLRGATYLTVIGRRAPGATATQAAVELSAIAARLAEQYPRTNAGVDFMAVPLREQLLGEVSPILTVLLGAVFLLLMVACANVAHLFLARTTGRRHEFAVRAALGARGWRLGRQLLAEGSVLAAAGGAAGLLLAHYAVTAIRRLAPHGLPRIDAIALDPRVVLFAALMSTLTLLFFGALPAWSAARTDPRAGMGPAARLTTGTRRRRLRSVFVVAQVAVSFVLVLGAGLLVRSFINLTHVDTGYRTDNVLAMSLFLYGRYNTPEQQVTFISQVRERILAVPGVASVGVSSSLPLHERITREDADIVPEGMPVPAPGEAPVVRGTTVSPGYFDALRVPLRQGRLFNAADDARAEPVALISESLARLHYAGQNPIGRLITVSFPRGPVPRRIVGVVGDVRHGALDDTPGPAVYVPYDQAPDGAVILSIRTNIEPVAVTSAVAKAIWELAPTLPLYATSTLDDLRAASLRVRRFVLLLLGTFAAAALTLATLGVYGVLSHATGERTREIGVRLALGARKDRVLGAVVANGAALAAAGLALGALAAAASTRLLRAMLFEVSTLDAATYLVVGALILACALAAALVPAWRASRLDPAMTLRD